MINARFTLQMLQEMAKLKGEIFVSYECAENFGTTYGNARINTQHFSIEFLNEVREMLLFGEAEEISMFSCAVKSKEEPFQPYCEEPYETFVVNEKIGKISIINDQISVNDGEYDISFDMAVVIETEKHRYMFSRGWFFSEVITISQDKSLDDVYPIQRVIEDWNDDGARTVAVHRTTRDV